MNAVPELSGVELARQALLAAREAAKKNGAQTKKPKRRTGTALRRDGREPLGLGAAISMMMTERGLAAPAAGGSVLAQWETILAAAAPELAGRVKATAFDEESGRLDVVPDAPAYGTKVRWIAPRLIEAANSAVPDANVRAVCVLAPTARTAAAAMSPAAADEPAPRQVVPAGPVKTRETASEGYRRALAAHHAVAPPRQEDPALAAAVVRQDQVRRELAATVFPGVEQDQEDEVPTSLEDVRAQQRQAAEAVRAAAIRRARTERSGQTNGDRAPTLRKVG
ncbi:DciA family protein [Streptomyces sp. SR27]|uniref:DciA family protein n=1 Tax=Streptomyces sp. SR27 TaxID=3076630 RepID=UPI00295BD78D|nr:DciA family protein [Streptomyces sp. SR27]MDV9193225.1 DciA family protein [Streptomyces sp. SR27]